MLHVQFLNDTQRTMETSEVFAHVLARWAREIFHSLTGLYIGGAFCGLFRVPKEIQSCRTSHMQSGMVLRAV